MPSSMLSRHRRVSLSAILSCSSRPAIPRTDSLQTRLLCNRNWRHTEPYKSQALRQYPLHVAYPRLLYTARVFRPQPYCRHTPVFRQIPRIAVGDVPVRATGDNVLARPQRKFSRTPPRVSSPPQGFVVGTVRPGTNGCVSVPPKAWVTLFAPSRVGLESRYRAETCLCASCAV